MRYSNCPNKPPVPNWKTSSNTVTALWGTYVSESCYVARHTHFICIHYSSLVAYRIKAIRISSAPAFTGTSSFLSSCNVPIHRLVIRLTILTGRSYLDNLLPSEKGGFLEHVDDMLDFCGDLERLLHTDKRNTTTRPTSASISLNARFTPRVLFKSNLFEGCSSWKVTYVSESCK